MQNNKISSRFQIGEFYLSRRGGKPTWYAAWSDSRTGQTRRESLATGDLEKAKLGLAAFVERRRRLHNELPAEVYLETILAHWFTDHGSGLASHNEVRYLLQRWSRHFDGVLLSELVPQRMRCFEREMRDEGLSDGYIRRVLGVGKAALNWAVKEGLIMSAPYIALPPDGVPRERVLSSEEMAALLAACHQDLPHAGLYLRLATGTGARPAALLQLTRQQIDFAAGLIHLNPPGRRQNKKHRPSVPMASFIREATLPLPEGPVLTYKGQSIATITSTIERLRAKARRLVRTRYARIARQLKKAGADAQTRDAIVMGRNAGDAILEISAYTIRHTVATELRRRGVPEWEAAGMLGHSTGYKTTERYAKYRPDRFGAAVRAIEEWWSEIEELTCHYGMRRAGTNSRANNVPKQSKGILPPPDNVLIFRQKMVGATGIEPVTPTMSR